jgi:hypothetical protein
MAMRGRTAFCAVGVLTVACGQPPVPELQSRAGVFVLDAGQRWALTYDAPPDDAAVGTTWTAGELAGSPLAPMARSALILKADDFGPAFSNAGVRFVEAVDRARALTTLGIMTAHLTHDEEQRAAYRELHAAGFELFFHGHEHRYRVNDAEFNGKVADQQAVLEKGLAVGRAAFGPDFHFHTLGAPGNAKDENTAPALLRVPEFVVWLYGWADLGVFVVDAPNPPNPQPGENLGLEQRDDNDRVYVADPGVAFRALEAQRVASAAPIAVAVQSHPRDWGDADLDRFADFLALIRESRTWRVVGPYDLWCWLQNSDGIALSKVSAQQYELDLRTVRYPVRLDLDPEVGPSPRTVAPVE